MTNAVETLMCNEINKLTANNVALRAQMEHEWLSWDAKRASLEKSAARVKVLEDALEQCLDDMDVGHSVCEATKQYARAALEKT